MSADSTDLLEYRVLLRTVTAKDAMMTTAVLARAGIDAQACATVAELVQEIGRGAGALVIAEEVLGDPEAASLVGLLQSQPAWSDLPVLLLARPGADSVAIVDAMEVLANLTVIERPLRLSALVSAVRSALRARRRQYELRGVLEGLRESDQRKTEFLATLAHELRNPLAPLSTALTLLRRQLLAPEQAQPYYEMMGRQIDHMVRLTNDLMEVSRITRGRIELRPEVLALDRVIQEAIELSRPLLDARRHELVLSLASGPCLVRGDGVRLTQVFSNLLNNAAKYTPPGGRIEIAMSQQDGEAVVCVRDNGIGIPADMRESVFGMFVQVSGTTRAAQGGLGIGLTLVKSLVELHGGRIRAHSNGSQGTEFRLELPLAAGAPRDPSIDTADRRAPLSGRILIVDDNRDAADSLATLLGALGADTAVAYSGPEALRRAAETRPDVAILDIGMPGMDGCELAHRLREPPQRDDLLLIALTGWGEPDHRERVAAAGFDRHLLKPVPIDALLELLQARPRSHAAGIASPSRASSR